MRALILLALLLAACGPSSPAAVPAAASPSTAAASPSPSARATAFDGARAFANLAYLADPARGGRYSGSSGYLEAAQYVAAEFKAIGLEPLGDGGTYFQRFTMPLVDLAATPTLSRTGAGAKSWKHRVDFTESVSGRAGNGTAEGSVVVVGGALKNFQQNDFAGVDLKGKIALVTGPSQGNIVESSFGEGALGVLVTGGTEIRYSYIPRLESKTIPVLVITDAVADELIAATGKRVADERTAVRARRADPSAPPVAFDVPATVRMSVPLTPVHDVEAINVVGLLRGNDPVQSLRAVAVGGHLDGVGTDPDGTVFAAANDNASGPAITIEVARALALRKAELKRSVVFVVFAGEEEGYLGSEAYVSKMSAIPGRVESLVAYLNLDVIGCCGRTLEASDDSRALQDRVRAAAGQFGIPFGAIPGGGGSDHATFARRGVPSTLILWCDIILHTPRDTIAMIDPKRLQQAGDVVTTVALDLARGDGP